MKQRASLFSTAVLAAAVLLGGADCTVHGEPADTNSAPGVKASVPADAAVSSTNGAAELPASALAFEQLRREIEATTARNTAAITSSLALLEPALSQLHSRQLELVQSSNKTILMVAGLFAGVGFIALISIVFILVRALGRFSELAAATNRTSMLTPPAAALGPGELVNVNATAVEQASARFQHAIEHLQKRIFELENTAQPAAALESGKTQSASKAASEVPAESVVPAMNIRPLPPHDSETRKPGETPDSASRVSLLLGKGQALLNLDQAAESLECFDEILTLDPNNTEALLRRGLAQEKLENWEKALECYDRALSIDTTLTVAYLYKGGVCNKLQRHREALDSYEHALHTEKRSRAS